MSDYNRGGSRVVKPSFWVKTAGWLVIGIVFSLLLVVAGGILTNNLIQMGMLPAKFLAVILGVLWLVLLLVVLLQFIRTTRVIGKLVALLLAVAFGVGAFFAGTFTGFLNRNSGVTVSVDTVNAYVLNEDPAQTIQDAKDYSFGILSTLDRNNTDEAVTAIESELDQTIAVTEYPSMADLARALQAGEIQAIVVNSAYLPLLEEEEELATFAEGIRVLWSHEIQRELNISHGDDTTSGAENPEAEGENADRQTDQATVLNENEDLQSFAVYISGNDAFGTLKSNGRSDVNILMAVNPNTRQILLVNTPRDYYVELAGIGEMDKLTHAGIYGVDMSMNTLGNLYGVDVNYYARMNFDGFIKIVDALGGITVTSDVDFTVGENHYVVGENELNGQQALTFARERYSFSEGDRQRGKNQMAVIKAVIAKAASPAILTGYLDIMSAVSDYFDTNMSQTEIAALVKDQLEQGGSWDVSTMSVDGSNGRSAVYSAPNSSLYVMIPDESSVQAAKDAILALMSAEP